MRVYCSICRLDSCHLRSYFSRRVSSLSDIFQSLKLNFEGLISQRILTFEFIRLTQTSQNSQFVDHREQKLNSITFQKERFILPVAQKDCGVINLIITRNPDSDPSSALNPDTNSIIRHPLFYSCLSAY